MYAITIESEGRGAFNLKGIIATYACIPYASLSLRTTMGGVGVLGSVDGTYRSEILYLNIRRWRWRTLVLNVIVVT